MSAPVIPALRCHEPPPGRFRVAGRPQLFYGLCDLQGGLGGRQVCGVDDLGLIAQPGAGRLGVGLEVLETEWGRDGMLPLDAPAEGVPVSVEDEVPYRNGAGSGGSPLADRHMERASLTTAGFRP